MIPMTRSLFEPLVWADSALLAAIRAHDSAPDDEEIRKLLHHTAAVERFVLPGPVPVASVKS